MPNAIILSAGQGKRLTPLTDNLPKCLAPFQGRPLLEWQVRALAACGVEDIAVVTGFKARAVEAAMKSAALPVRLRFIFNPFYAVADNIGSCWAAMGAFGEDTLLLNGDTMFEPSVVETLLGSSPGEITVTIDRKAAYDADDMKVRSRDGRLERISKALESPVDAESIGMIRFRGQGGARFVTALRNALDDQAALKRWYLSVIDELAQEGGVDVASIEGRVWSELDYPADLRSSEATAARIARVLFDRAGAAAV